MRRIAVAMMAVGFVLAGVGVAGIVATAGEDSGTAAPTQPGTIALPPSTTTTAARTTTSTAAVTTTAAGRESEVRAFVPELVAAIRAGDNGFKFDRLHPLVIERYGAETCRSGLTAAQPAFVMEVVSVGAPEPWEWVTDGLTTTVEATPVAVKRTDADGALVDGVIHLAEAGGAIRWFTDCGTPLSS